MDSPSLNAMLYFFSDTMTRSRGNIAEPATTVAGAMPLTRTFGPRPIASSRIRWLIAALLTSYGSLPCFGTTAFAELVRTTVAGSPCALKISFASCASTWLLLTLIAIAWLHTCSGGVPGAGVG